MKPLHAVATVFAIPFVLIGMVCGLAVAGFIGGYMGVLSWYRQN